MAANPEILVKFLADVSKLTAGARQVATSGEAAGAATRKISWMGIAKFAAGAAGLAVAGKYIKSSVAATEDLAKSTMALSRITGMDTKTASEWSTVLKVRGLSVQTFQRGMVMLSRQMELASSGSKRSASAFQQLGVSMADVRAGNTQSVIMQISDGLAKIENPAKRAALAQQLFSRTGLQLAPILFKGSAAIQSQLNLAGKYGATLGVKTTKDLATFIARQRELKIASEGVKVQLGTALIPVLLAVSGVIVGLAHIFQPLLANATAMKIVIAALALAFVAYQAAVVATTIAQVPGLAAFVAETAAKIADAAATVALTVAVWALDAGLLVVAATIGLVILAIAAIVVAGILLVKHWDDVKAAASAVWSWVKSAAESAFNWIKANWPLLLGILVGPFGLAVALIVTHWNTIRAAITTALAAIRGAIVAGFNAVVGAVRSAMSSVVGAVLAAAGRARAAASSVGAAIRGGFAGAAGWLVGAGRAIVQGLISGIESMIGAAVSAVSKLASLAQKAFSLINKIKSPSLVYAGFGEEIVRGLALGITRNAGLVSEALAGLTPSVLTATTTPVALGSSGPVEVHVYIGDQELRGLVRTEIVSDNTRVARRILAGSS